MMTVVYVAAGSGDNGDGKDDAGYDDYSDGLCVANHDGDDGHEHGDDGEYSDAVTCRMILINTCCADANYVDWWMTDCN